MDEHPPLTETLIGLLVLIMVGAQTWVVINEATHGDAARTVSSWWRRVGEPALVRVVTWIDAPTITQRMVTDEIEPLLKGDA